LELYLHSPNTPSWRGAQLKKKLRDNFTFTFRGKRQPSSCHANWIWNIWGFYGGEDSSRGLPGSNTTRRHNPEDLDLM